ncbi:heme exporter protein CcmB [Methylibium petroleiphilum]|uniref:Heme exporter protein B n=1 Tax=Methylibium petroleiphilum (strain ATCC BAA-1232 / LMG 22953 / PM1) TaxID=420662 RepID=A2SF37_METPP|nr:heme exporter protein CcmB [Methylibium petroleiphilum]ABM94176.1 ABC transporter, permease domain protein [Methylibium petroleiphilum PM1]
MRDLFLAVYLRDLRLALRRRVETLMPVAFFVVTASLFPLGVGPEPQVLRQLAPGLAWVCALLAAMLSVSQLFASDFADGSLEQMLLTGRSAVVIAAAKSAAHWTLSGLPLIAAAPLLGLLFDVHRDALGALLVSLLLGTPVLSLLGAVGAALTLGLRSAGVLLLLLVLPLTIPALIFGTGAVAAVDAGLSPGGHFSILGALLILTALTAPVATAAALRISLE